MVSSVVLKSRGNVKNEVVDSILFKLRQAVGLVVSLDKMWKTHDKVAMHAMAVIYGGKFVDIFLKVFTFLQSRVQSHGDVILQLDKKGRGGLEQARHYNLLEDFQDNMDVLDSTNTTVKCQSCYLGFS